MGLSLVPTVYAAWHLGNDIGAWYASTRVYPLALLPTTKGGVDSGDIIAAGVVATGVAAAWGLSSLIGRRRHFLRMGALGLALGSAVALGAVAQYHTATQIKNFEAAMTSPN